MPANAFVVRRRVRREYNHDEIPDPRVQYWAAFETRAEAEAHARQLDRAELLVNGCEENLFEKGVGAISSMPEPIFRDWLMDGGIDPPDGNSATAWRKWWQLVAPPEQHLTRDQILRILDGLDRLTLQHYEVVSIPKVGRAFRTATTGFAVVHHCWEYGDDFYYGSNEALTLYRTREEAEAERQRRTNAEKTRSSDWNGGPNEFVIVELQLDPEG